MGFDVAGRLTVAECADTFGLSPYILRQRIKSGRLVAQRVGAGRGVYLVAVADVVALLQDEELRKARRRRRATVRVRRL